MLSGSLTTLRGKKAIQNRFSARVGMCPLKSYVGNLIPNITVFFRWGLIKNK
jgi:hypothetical protein